MSSPTSSSEVHTAGQSQPPPIPPAVLALTLFAVWEDDDWLDEYWIEDLDGGYDIATLKTHDQLRNAVRRLLEKLAEQCPTKPSTRTFLYSEAEVSFKDRVYACNPFEENMEKEEPSSGKLDNCLYAHTRESKKVAGRANPKFAILIIEIKPADIEADGITPAKALDVDQQIRRRANGAKEAGVINQHLYLIGWVGCWFRPYYWQAKKAEDGVRAAGPEDGSRTEEGIREEDLFEPNRSLGVMRPSKISECMFLVSRLLTPPSQAMPICATAPPASLKVLRLLCGGT
jgi:hypothetical protein